MCFLALEGVQLNCPQQHSVADHIRCYFFWCEVHSIKTHQSFPWSIFWRDTRGTAVLYKLEGVDELGWCVLPLMGSPKRIYIKNEGKKTVFVVVAQRTVRVACPKVAPDIWGPQEPCDDGYLNIVPLLEPASILLSFILFWGGKRFVLVFTFTPVHTYYMYVLLPLSLLYFSPEMYLSLLVIGRVKLCGETAQMIPLISALESTDVATVETLLTFSVYAPSATHLCFFGEVHTGLLRSFMAQL